MALYANTQAVNAGHKIITKSGDNLKKEGRMKGFYMTEKDIDAKSQAMPEIAAMLKVSAGG